jgi:UDP-2,4-diacetamido-2,4,6-trideoxy-beta-L-altropyranose hydrolase
LSASYLFRVDASVRIGTGHVMRCLTLAKELEKRSANCVFVCQAYQGDCIEHIKENGFKVLEIKSVNNEFEINKDANNTLEIIAGQKFDWIIIDHYEIDVKWESKVRAVAKKIMVIDDLANRKHDCDLLLDQNIRMNAKERYKKLIPNECISFFGPTNVILRTDYDNIKIKKRTGEIKHILVYFGGNDIHNQAFKSIKALQQYPDISADIIIGSNHVFQDMIIKESTNKLIVSKSIDMYDAMKRADLAFGVCGVAAWERCAIGLPTLACINAENQREDSENLNQLGAIDLIGESNVIDTDDWCKALNRAINNKEYIAKMGKNASKVVAGHTNNRERLVNLLCNKSNSSEGKLNNEY